MNNQSKRYTIETWLEEKEAEEKQQRQTKNKKRMIGAIIIIALVAGAIELLYMTW